jgi:hypothetical protein
MNHLTKFPTMEYQTVDGKSHQCPLLDAFVLAICHSAPGGIAEPHRFMGLNMTIVLGDNPAARKCERDLLEHFRPIPGVPRNGLFTVYLLGRDGSRIPVEIHGGNGWNDPTKSYDYGYGGKTCCYSGYISPCTFDLDGRGRFWKE